MRRAYLLLLLLVLLLLSGCGKGDVSEQPIPQGELEAYRDMEEPEAIISQEVIWPSAPEVEDLSPPDSAEKVSNLPQIEYSNISLKLTKDMVVDHIITFRDCYIDMNNHSLTFLPSSRVRIISSTIANAPPSMNDNTRFLGRPASREPIGLAVKTHNFIMEDSVVKYSSGHGIHFLDSKGAVIEDTVFLNNKWAALRADRSFVSFVNNTLIGNGCENPKNHCVEPLFSSITYTESSGCNIVSNHIIGDALFVEVRNLNMNRNVVGRAVFQSSTGAASNNFIEKVVAVASEKLEVRYNFLKHLPSLSWGQKKREATFNMTFPNYINDTWTEDYSKGMCRKYYPIDENCTMVLNKEQPYILSRVSGYFVSLWTSYFRNRSPLL